LLVKIEFELIKLTKIVTDLVLFIIYIRISFAWHYSGKNKNCTGKPYHPLDTVSR